MAPAFVCMPTNTASRNASQRHRRMSFPSNAPYTPDLRGFIEFLEKEHPEQVVRIRKEVDPKFGVSGIIERLERLEEDKQAVMTDMKEVFAEAKGEGYDVKTLRKVIRIRKQDKAKRQEEEAILDLYLSALGEV